MLNKPYVTSNSKNVGLTSNSLLFAEFCYLWRLMKKIGFVLLLFGALFSSCSTELDINADWQENTVVYSIVNRANSAHYIRIHKAYLDPSRSALASAGIKDSLYYGNISVVIEELSNDAVVNTINCERVDTNALQPGIFAHPDQVIYRFYTPNGMDSSHIYKLKITRPSGDLVQSSLAPIGGFTNRDVEQRIFPPNISNFITFTGINWSAPSGNHRVVFRAPRNAKSWDLTVRVLYNEWETSGSIADSVLKTVDWPIVRRSLIRTVNTSGSVGEAIDYRIFGKDLFGFMASSIPVDPTKTRRMRGTAFILTFTDEPLTDFLTLNTSSQSATDIRPEYTNIQNGYGIFGSSYQMPSAASMANSPYDAFSYRQVQGGSGTDSLRARYPQLNFVP